jgi:hypothetical protein
LGYYWLALRNERFHQWNRFYLLSATVLSVVIPFFHLPLMAEENPALTTVAASLPGMRSVFRTNMHLHGVGSCYLL